MQIITYTPSTDFNADFYIQNKGLHAGRPLKKPIPNCWVIKNSFPNAFEFCLMLYYSKEIKNLIKGSVIPFITLHDYRKLIERQFDLSKLKDCKMNERLNLIHQIDKLINIKEVEFEKLKELKRLHALQLYRDLYIQKAS